MPLNIAVCVKAVPNPEQYEKIMIDPVKKTLVREGITSVINPSDLHAIELALQLKEQFGGKAVLISMGPTDATKQLREALAYGLDEAYLISDRRFGGADTLATSYTLSKGLNKIGKFDIVLAGNESADGATSQVPSQLGEWLNLPHIMEVVALDMNGEEVALVRKKVDNSFMDFKVKLPAVIAVSKSINTVRYPNMKGILTSKNKKIQVISKDDFDNLEENFIGFSGSPTQPGEIKTISYERKSELIQGTKEEISDNIIQIIKPLIEII